MLFFLSFQPRGQVPGVISGQPQEMKVLTNYPIKLLIESRKHEQMPGEKWKLLAADVKLSSFFFFFLKKKRVNV